MREVREFTCPGCGSHQFGTTGTEGQMVGDCHGHGCRFSWPREEDDRYFVGTGRFEESEGIAVSSR